MAKRGQTNNLIPSSHLLFQMATTHRAPKLYPYLRYELFKFFSRDKLEESKLVSRRWVNNISRYPSQFHSRHTFENFVFGIDKSGYLNWTDLPDFQKCCQELKVRTFGSVVLLFILLK